jgi:hypothetical protein
MKKYFPILVSKKGELVAMQHLSQNVKDEISPLIEIIKGSMEKKKKREDEDFDIIHTDDLENYFKTHWSFFGNQVMLDFSLFEGLETEILRVQKLLHSIMTSGVNVVPVIQYNSENKYYDLVSEIIAKYANKICIRMSGAGGGMSANYNGQIEEVLAKLKITPDRVILVVDLGQVDSNYGKESLLVSMLIQGLKIPLSKWSNVVVASSSFPEDLSDFDSASNPQKIKRYEWEIWKDLQKVSELKNLKYGDYGTKHSVFKDSSFVGTVSLKYTTENEYVIYRGEMSKPHELGNRQYIQHIQALVKSKDFSGGKFSWGDSRIEEMSKQDANDLKSKPGNATIWVQNSQNHHLTLLHNLL